MNLVEEISVSRMNERRRYCSDAAANYWRKVIRGVDQAENPMMRRARQEESRSAGHVALQPARRVLQRVVGHDDPLPLLRGAGDALRDRVHLERRDAVLHQSGGGHLFFGGFARELQSGVL